ncbi:symmetrical bis(5'-nucleosyl)-tetraphosphatase [Colwellia sp. 4_MG-2023]|uniref:symmetrical bis(5'-nucleosyl)-tetraphosphatase n=1 Tax=unclassified Colwellia TaxID=196834 RepID=UPI0026E261B0|nr:MULTISPECIES: symmetrical bis(5'-nucleosyl)-tetraphosphatase [unclassified Colwellia]MDO6506326.1 symmetrical bis(5'-nucleosyl)-tetraphosphatase [Colwellia sp. 5_MG-2023]MDO6555150.1 symmetrical bis(5'-nucleosyl)-tetraphosphatase [Colwellia sp. 4_MG-2023]
MAIYLVGDIQGCYSELKALLKKVAFNQEVDQLYLAGDLVARGPDSLATLRFVKSLKHSAKVVLGNHDLHLLAVYAGIKKVKEQDKLTSLLAADDVDDLMNWLAQQPLLQQIGNDNAYMSHAGISPQWNLQQAITQANLAQMKLSAVTRNYWLSAMYGEQPDDWQQAKTAEEKFRYTINSFTRMRYCYPDKRLEFHNKSAPATLTSKLDSTEKKQETLLPWYEISPTIKKSTWVFGHWAALMGNCSVPNVYALDTGCVWGKHLTMLRWHDKKTFIEQSHLKSAK